MIKNLANLGDGYFQDRVWLWRRHSGRSKDHEREVLGSSFAIFKLFRGNLLLKIVWVMMKKGNSLRIKLLSGLLQA